MLEFKGEFLVIKINKPIDLINDEHYNRCSLDEDTDHESEDLDASEY